MRAFTTRARAAAPVLIALAGAGIAPGAAAPAPGKPADARPFERRLHPDRVEASSFLWNDSSKFLENHHPSYVADDDPATAWVEGAASSGRGEWLRLSVGSLRETTRVRLRVRNGCQRSRDAWRANARAKAVTVRVQPGPEKQVTLTDTDGWQEIVIATPSAPVERIELAIDSVYEGARSTDLCISDVQVFATSTERDHPELEKRKLEDLTRWRRARMAAARLFASLPAGYPLYPSYEVRQVGQPTQDWPPAEDVLALAVKDPGFAQEWPGALSAARALTQSMGTMTRAQLAPASQTRLVEVDGTQLGGVYDPSGMGGEWPTKDTIRLPMLGLAAALFTDQLRVVDVTTGPTIAQYGRAPKGCGADVAWVARTRPKEGPSRITAIAVGRCQRVVGRGGVLYNATAIETMIYDPGGKLVLISGPGHLEGYRWAMDGGKPMLSGGRSMRLDGSILETRRRTPAAAP